MGEWLACTVHGTDPDLRFTKGKSGEWTCDKCTEEEQERRQRLAYALAVRFWYQVFPAWCLAELASKRPLMGHQIRLWMQAQPEWESLPDYARHQARAVWMKLCTGPVGLDLESEYVRCRAQGLYEGI